MPILIFNGRLYDGNGLCGRLGKNNRFSLPPLKTVCSMPQSGNNGTCRPCDPRSGLVTDKSSVFYPNHWTRFNAKWPTTNYHRLLSVIILIFCGTLTKEIAQDKPPTTPKVGKVRSGRGPNTCTCGSPTAMCCHTNSHYGTPCHPHRCFVAAPTYLSSLVAPYTQTELGSKTPTTTMETSLSADEYHPDL